MSGLFAFVKGIFIALGWMHDERLKQEASNFKRARKPRPPLGSKPPSPRPKRKARRPMPNCKTAWIVRSRSDARRSSLYCRHGAPGMCRHGRFLPNLPTDADLFRTDAGGTLSV